MLLAVSTTKDRYNQVETCLNYLLGIVGIGLIALTIYNVIIDPGGFFTIANL